jgi:hypothetical protein
MNATAQRIDDHLNDIDAAPAAPVCELSVINSLLDVLNIPRDYPGSNVPHSTKERVSMLVYYCVMQGIEWHKVEEVF